MKMSGIFFTVLLIAGAVSGLQWSDHLRVEGQPIQICSGQPLQLFWNFTLDIGERLKGMEWRCHPEGKDENVMATYVDEHFVPTSSFSGRVSHLKYGGIELSCATILESGIYSIVVSTEDKNNKLNVHRKTVTVKVVDRPKTQTGEIHVTRKEKAVRDVTTGAWHVQLFCGNFSDLGHPPVDVTWTNPRGDQLDSTDFQEGFFQLLLPNPLVGGNYSCSLPQTQAAARCLAGHSPLLDTVSVEVEENAGRILLLEAQQQELLEELQADRDTWRRAMEDVANRRDDLEKRTDDLEKRTDDQEKRTEDLEKRTDDQEERTDDLEKRTDDVEKRTDGQAKRTEDLEKRTDDVEKRTDDLEKRTDDQAKRTENLEKRTDDLENRSGELENWRDDTIRTAGSISFHASLSYGIHISDGVVLKLSNVISNQGEGYNPSTGHFTAPLNGTYFFIATTGSHSSEKYANMRLMKGDTQLAATFLKLHGSYYSMGSCHAAVSLSAGEKVWLQSSASSYFASSVTFFSGFRIA